MKKYISLFLVFVLALSLCACKQNQEDTQNAEPAIPFGNLFSITEVKLTSDIARAKRYLNSALKESSVRISDTAKTNITVMIDESMADNDYAYIVDSATSVTIRGGDKNSAVNGLTAFVKNHLRIDNPCANEGMWLKYTEYPDTVTDDHVPNWFIQSETERNIADGVTYRERLYIGANEKPYRAFILTANPEKVTLHYGTSEDGYTLYPEVFQDVRQHMQASVSNGHDVIAAVNADFFEISGDYHPFGLTIKNGTLLSPKWPTYPYSGVTKDGKFVVEPRAELKMDVSHLQNAIGARNVLVKEGEVKVTNVYLSKGMDPHPRTMAGLLPDGKLLLVVVDGRQFGWSNGATLDDGAHLMKSLGCVTAINHDGGGSSTMIIRYADEYFVKNSPSDGGLRKVYGSIQIVKK